MTPRKISSAEIRQIVADYLPFFPGWKVIGGDKLLRVDGLIGQSIWFDRLRTGAYRPASRLHVWVAPGPGEGSLVLAQVLDIKNREVALQSHAQQLRSVVDALKSEIVPSVVKPLDAKTVAELLASQACGRPTDTYALACLLAALGRSEEARGCIAHYHEALRLLELPFNALDRDRAEYLAKVETWMKQSTAVVELRAVAESEKAKLALL
jgi:hypothetical protein